MPIVRKNSIRPFADYTFHNRTLFQLHQEIYQIKEEIFLERS
jgi:hypothetical protein